MANIEAFPAMITEEEVAFRAGKCNWDGKLVSPDKRPGMLSVSQGDDGLMRVRWTNRDTRLVEEDLIVIQDAYLERITKCTTGRVYVLRFTSSDRKVLIWLQEPDASKDKEFIDAFNAKIGATIPPKTEMASASGETVSRGNVDREQLTNLVGQFVSQWQQQPTGATGATTASRVTLADILRPETLSGLLEDDAALEEIRGHLPAGRGGSTDEIRQVLRSAQFGEAVRSLNETISTTDQLPSVAEGRQTLLFSATLSESVRDLQIRLGERRRELAEAARAEGKVAPVVKEMALVDLNPEEKPPPRSVLEQRYLFIPRHVKIAYLVHVLSAAFGIHPSTDLTTLSSSETGSKKTAVRSQGIVFVATCKMCQLVTVTLQLMGFAATGLHSLQNQKRRSATVGKIRAQRAAVLVATDVASRGLDLPKVAFVIHFDFPRTYQDYVHRVGRTARAKRKGIALAMVTEKDVDYVLEVEKRLGHKLEKHEADEEAVMLELNSAGQTMSQASLMMHDTGFDELLEDRKKKRQAARSRTEVN